MMQLYYSPTSPYVRKVHAMLLELDLMERVELVTVNPHERPDALVTNNPLSKIPVLVTDDGAVLYDSPVICAYVDSLHDGPKMIPAEGAARWRHLTFEALCDGIIDAAVARVLEGRRPPDRQHAPFVAGQKAKIDAGLDALEAGVEALTAPDGPTDLASLCAGIALGYLDLRCADDRWRDGRPRLAAWEAAFVERPSMQATVPRG